MTPEIRAECGSFYIGPDRMFLLYFVRGTTVVNVVAHARQPGREEEGWSIPAETSDFLALYEDFVEPVHTGHPSHTSRESLQVGVAGPAADAAVDRRPRVVVG